MKRDKIITLAALLLAAPAMLQAAVITLYDGSTGNIGTDTAAFNVHQDFDDGGDPAVETVYNVAAPTPFGTGNAMVMVDMVTTDKPELRGELGAPLTGAYRFDFQAYNQSTYGGSKAIRFRLGNTGENVGSEGNTPFSLSWQADGKVTAKYDDGGSRSTLSSDPLLNQVLNISVIGNNSTSTGYGYSLFGETRSLNMSSYDVYINGVLFNSDVEFANGLAYTLPSSSGYDPALGTQAFGLLGSGNSDIGPDVMFDNIILRTGTDVIPEPATLSLMGLTAGAFLFIRRRRRI